MSQEEKKNKFGIIDVALQELTGKTNYVSDEIRMRRLDICRNCPHLIKLTNQCSACGCFVKSKTRYAESSCPMGKWKSEKPKE